MNHAVRAAGRRLLTAIAAGALASVCALGLTQQTSHAIFIMCRDDPTVTLSNGQVLSLWTDIADVPSDIQAVNYVLHLPRWTQVKSVARDSNSWTEHLRVVNDLEESYRADVTVLSGHRVSVTAFLKVGNGEGLYRASGESGHTLFVGMRSGDWGDN